MTIESFLLQSFKKDYIFQLEWFYSIFSIAIENTNFVKLDNGTLEVLIDDNKFEKVKGIKIGDEPVLTEDISITLKKGDLACVDKDTETTVGEFIINVLLIEYPFNGKIKYISDKKGMLNFGSVYKKKIIPLLISGEITPEEVSEFGRAITFIRILANLFVISSTEKALIPPKGIIEFRKKRIKEYKEKYGEDCFKDKVRVAELEEELVDYIKEYLKDDPAYGISYTGKVISNSMKKRYGTFGAEDGISGNDEAIFIENSLLEGLPRDKRLLANAFNSSRAASYFRGKETQTSGVISDTFTRAFTGLFTENNIDCGRKYGFKITITEANHIYYIGRYYFVNGKSVLIKTLKDAEALIGKTIELRVLQYCKNKSILGRCMKCSGELIGSRKNGLYLLSLDIGSAAMKSNLKRMHVAGAETIEFTLEELFGL